MQTTVQNAMAIGVPGQIADLANNESVAYANYSKQLDRLTISADDTTTTITLDGTAYTYTGGGGETKAQIAALLYAAINAGTDAVAYYTAATEYVDVEALTPGTALTVAATASCVLTHRIGNSAAINYGLLVVQDEKDADKAAVPILTTDVTTVGKALGVTVHTQADEQSYASSGGTGYALGDCMSVMRKGRIYVEVEDAVVAGGAAFVRFTATSPEILGAFRSDADTADAVALPNAFFRTAAAAGGIAVLEINLP